MGSFLRSSVVGLAIGVSVASAGAAPVSTAFTYQGQLKDGGVPVTATCDFGFRLFDAATTPPGSQVGPTLTFEDSGFTPNPISVVNGLFEVALNFGSSAFSGEARWLEIAVSCPSGGGFTTLNPRQPIALTPYAQHALSVETVSWNDLTNIPNGFADGVDDPSAISCAGGQVVTGFSAAGTIVCTADQNSTLSEAQVEAFVVNGALDLAAGTTLNGAAVSTGPHTTSLPWGAITAIPAGFADGIDDTGGDGHSLDAADGVPVDALFVDNDGDVGIGTTSAAERLDVVGNIRASGTIQSGSSITIDGSAGSEHILSSDALELHISSGRALRLEPADPNVFNQVSSNVIGGYSGNSVTAGVVGATISGGGLDDLDAGQSDRPNRVTDHFGTVAGGDDNRAGDDLGTTADARLATVGGGSSNVASGEGSTVSGGFVNTASGLNSTAGGGIGNIASGKRSTVPGGDNNTAGGDFSFAAGRQARVRDASQAGDDPATCFSTCGDEGTFVWADTGGRGGTQFFSTGPNQFLVRASGGVGIGTNSPMAGFQLDVAGDIRCVSLTETSSRSLKENITPIEGALDKVARLQGVRFNWTPEHGGKPDLGFVAEDVAKVLPELVTWEEEGVTASGLKYGHITAVLIEAVKELHAAARNKDASIESLRAENTEMMLRLTRIERLLAKATRGAKTQAGTKPHTVNP